MGDYYVCSCGGCETRSGWKTETTERKEEQDPNCMYHKTMHNHSSFSRYCRDLPTARHMLALRLSEIGLRSESVQFQPPVNVSRYH